MERAVEMLQSLLYLIVSVLASVAEAVCGIGGGVIIKPVLDLFHMGSAAAISFLCFKGVTASHAAPNLAFFRSLTSTKMR